MIFSPLPLDGTWSVEIEPKPDSRGFFARTWCRAEFAQHGIEISIEQASISSNSRAGTLRGMHFTWPPSREGKLVSCRRGRVHDVLLDLRPTSGSYLSSVAIELDAQRGNAVFIPQGLAHGFLTLVDDTVVAYMMSDAYRPELADGVRFDDPAFALAWPLPISCIGERDREWPLFDEAGHRRRMLSSAGPA